MPTRQASRQLDLFDARQLAREARLLVARRVADEIALHLGERVRLTVHDNRSTMVSFRRAGGGVPYRVHHMFLEAPAAVVQGCAALSRVARTWPTRS